MPLRLSAGEAFSFSRRAAGNWRFSLVTGYSRGHSEVVSYPRLVLLCAILCTLSSCAYYYSPPPEKPYWAVRVTDIEGRLVAEWIAEGSVHRTETGYQFKAVQR